MKSSADVLFCPFCRDPFEGERVCPDHGLRLVPWQALRPMHTQLPAGATLPLWDPTHGRGLVFAGALLALVGFLLPLAHLSGDVRADSTLFDLARGHEKSLWIVPAAACGQLAVLVRRRSPGGLRAVRLSVLWLALLPSVAVGLTLSGVRDAVELLNQRAAGEVLLSVGVGTWLVLLALPVSLVGAAHLGRSASPRPVRVELVD